MRTSTRIFLILLIMVMSAIVGVSIYRLTMTPEEPEAPLTIAPTPAEAPQEEVAAKIPIEFPEPAALTPEWEVRRMIQAAEENPSLAEVLIELSKDGVIDVEETQAIWQPALVRHQVERCKEIWTEVNQAMVAATENPVAAGLKKAATLGVEGAAPAGAFSSQPVLSADLPPEEWTKIACGLMLVAAIRQPELAQDFEAILADGKITNQEVEQDFTRAQTLRTQQQLIDNWRQSRPKDENL